MTKCHRLGDLHGRNLSSHSSGGRKSEVKASAGLRAPKGSREGRAPGFPQLLGHDSLTPVFTWHCSGVHVCVQISPLDKDLVALD